ncbi:MAG: nicotinate-nucleotide adenylyltransferase [Coriobacteriales bacterium]
MRERIGIMGGTFDPVHNGHLAVAASVAKQLDLDRVLFIPTGNPNFKQGLKIAPASERAHMVALAIKGEPLFQLDLREVERSGVTYTADTLEELTRCHEGAQLFFIMGTDSALTLPGWKRAEDVARLCTVVVAKRPGQSTRQVREVLAASLLDFDVVYLDVPQVDVSSTQLRERIAQGRDVSDMIPTSVMAYIDQTGLYQDVSGGQAPWHIEREGLRA